MIEIPRKFEVVITEAFKDGRFVAKSFYKEKPFGNDLTDNNYVDDGYRFHDIFHLAYAAVLGWSPLVRNFIGCQRNIYDDSLAAIKIEEMISAVVFALSEPDFYKNNKNVKKKILTTIQKFITTLEVKDRSFQEWEKAILVGFDAWHKIRKYRRGIVKVNLNRKTLEVIPFS